MRSGFEILNDQPHLIKIGSVQGFFKISSKICILLENINNDFRNFREKFVITNNISSDEFCLKAD